MMPARFPAAVVRDWGKLEITDIPACPVGAYDAVCRVEACSICAATDSHLIDGTFPRTWCPKPPFVLGHESAGRVVAVGPKVRNFKTGQRVVRPMWQPDVPRLGGFGSAWGGFVAWAMVRDTWAYAQDTGQPTVYGWRSSQALPEMPARDATLFVTWRDTMSCLLQLNLQPGQRLVIFGSGGNGLSFVRFGFLMGARVVMVGNPAREAAALGLGAAAFVDYRKGDKVPQAVRQALDGQGADIAIEAVGTEQHLPQIRQCLDPGGRLFLFGIPSDPRSLEVAANDGSGRYVIVPKKGEEWQAHSQVLNWYLSGQLDPDDFSDATMPFDRIHEAFALIRRKEAVKITLHMPH